MSDEAGTPGMAERDGIPEAVLEAFPALDGGAHPVEGEAGLLHVTKHLRATDGREFVLQRVSPVFAPEIHDNIEAVTRHLARRGFETFSLERTRKGHPFLDLGSAGRWRLMTRLPGVSFHRIESVAQADSAGELVGRFHRALEDFEGLLLPMGIPFRETETYLAQLDAAIELSGEEENRARALSLRDRIHSALGSLGPPPVTRERVIHGDLKISNVLFEGPLPRARDRAVALIDFDTLMRAPLYCEWGDAWRSWCNRRGEDERDAEFDLEIFEASLRGFARGLGLAVERAGGGIDRAERASLVDATERIALELATRYATDLLEERYFAWDAERFERASEHNVIRAEGQLALFEAARSLRSRREQLIEDVLAGGTEE